MPRTRDEIEAEIAAAKAAGVHHSSAKVRGLREELKALDGPGECVVDEAKATVETYVSDPFDSDEWRFLERCIAEFELETNGAQSDAVKNLYQKTDYKLRIWRIAREIVAQVGVGAPWPQWAALGRNPHSGEKIATKPAAPAAPQPAKAPTVSEGGMPVRSANPGRDAILALVTGGDPRVGVKQDIASRTEPARTPEPAAV